MNTYPTALLVILAALLLSLSLYRRRSKQSIKLPPGPAGYPFIGNAFDKAGIFDWRLYPDHRERWGDLTSISIFGTTIVTVHTYEKAVEMLEKKSLIYSCRARLQMLHLGGFENHVAFLPYGGKLQECRRMIRSEINPVNTPNHYAIHEATVRRFLRTLAKSPEQFYERIEWYTGSGILKMVYGYETLEDNDPFIASANKVLSHADEGTQPGNLVELMPWLQYFPPWFPFAGFKRKTMSWTNDYARLLQEPFQYAATRMDSSEDTDTNFIARWLKKLDPDSETQLYNLKESALIFFSAGVETTSITLLYFFYVMQRYPEIQKQAQAEIDAVVGIDRLPSFSDRPDLPYLNALCKELLRHNVPLPAGVPHRSTAEDVHGGYYVPEGSIIVPSIAEMARDPLEYKDPELFNPSRFLGSNPERDPSLYVFGFGRRICSGLLFAQNTLFIAMATILASFDISAAVQGMELEFCEGITNHPLPFKCRITPRCGDGREPLSLLRE